MLVFWWRGFSRNDYGVDGWGMYHSSPCGRGMRVVLRYSRFNIVDGRWGWWC